MAQYKYTSSVTSAFTLNDGNDYHLFQGGVYELPAENEHIKALVDQGYLEPVEAKTKSKPATNSNSDKQ